MKMGTQKLEGTQEDVEATRLHTGRKEYGALASA